MAIVPFVLLPMPYERTGGYWDLAASDEGAPWVLPHVPLITVQITGDFGAGSIAIHGALHPTTPAYAPMYDHNGFLLTALADAYIVVLQASVTFLKPVATGITGVRVMCLASGR